MLPTSAKKKPPPPQSEMMVSEKETTRLRKFVCGQLRDEPDLSKLTLGILKKRYLAHVGRESLSPDARNYMKQVVEEELMKMQDNDKNGSKLEPKKPQNKRKREEENVEVISEDQSMAKKSRCQSNSSSESEEKEECKTGSKDSEEEDQIKSGGSEDEEQELEKLQQKTNVSSKQQTNSDESTDESSSGGSPAETMRQKVTSSNDGATISSNTSKGKKTRQSDEEDENETDHQSERSDKINSNESSDDDEKEKVSKQKTINNPDSDSSSSSLPSLADEQDRRAKNKKKKSMKTEDSTRNQQGDDKAIVKLKRYIALCGVRQNYKKLFDGCGSVNSKVAVLKKELEALGVHGKPSLQKCKKVRMKREEDRELADLDVSNIIATQGRPKRRAALAWQKPDDPPLSKYQHTLNSSSDSDQENNTPRVHRRATDWANLRGIISDDASSD
uniref:Histone chaperone domain-containing protein n=1 Tax=Monopterus albus TaxID=43700 RepID=A0A3Q3K7R8_MONAL|nr:HIRA-interacting protein 3 [Monopterus albus]